MDTLEKIVQIANKINYEDIPNEAIEASKKDILDTIGCLYAGIDAEGCLELLDVISDWGGKQESTVLYHGIKVPAPYAALINSTTAHARDLDDTHDGAVLHAGISVIPAALAVAERTGDCDGKLFLKAVTLGLDFLSRLGKATTIGPNSLGMAFTPMYAYFGSALTAGIILRLNNEQLVNAIGITMSQVAGTVQAVSDAALTKRIQPAFGAQAGVAAAIMAQKGITGARNVFDGKFSFPKVYLNGNFNHEVLMDGYGEYFEGVNLAFKPYPCCRFTHPAIDAALELRNEHNFNLEDIEKIDVRVTEQANIVCEPIEKRRTPRVIVDAQFSIPYTVATALIMGKVFIDDFTKEAIKNESVIKLSNKVSTSYDESLGGRGISPAVLSIHLKDKTVLETRVDHPKGNIHNSFSFNELVEKFEICTELASEKVSKDGSNKIVNNIKNLENIDANQLIESLV